MISDEIPILTMIANHASQTQLPGHIKPEARVSSDISETVMKVVPNFPGARLTLPRREWPNCHALHPVPAELPNRTSISKKKRKKDYPFSSQ